MTIDQATLDRMANTFTIDITTWGRRSGTPVRIEIWWFRVDGNFYITGTPGRRDWVANLMADPSIIVHALGEEFTGKVRFVTDEPTRHRVLGDPQATWYRSQRPMQSLIADAPMVEVLLT